MFHKAMDVSAEEEQRATFSCSDEDPEFVPVLDKKRKTVNTFRSFFKTKKPKSQSQSCSNKSDFSESNTTICESVTVTDTASNSDAA